MISVHSDRARYVTEQVALWIANDRPTLEHARVCLREGRAIVDGGLGSNPYSVLATSITLSLKRVAMVNVDRRPWIAGSAAWQVAQELAPNDYARINWADVADEIAEET